jgi:membrane associated rhomboid family serine protease
VFPFIDTAPRAKPPVVVLALIAANFAVFLWMQSLPPRMLEATLVHYALIPLRYTDAALAVSIGLDPTNFLPMLTDMFLHGGWMHIIFNMWFLWIFGPALEARFGRLGFLALYLMGGVTANIVHVATHLDSTEPVIGASGAVAAVIAAYAVSYPWARVLTIVPIGFIPLFIPVPAFLFAFVWFGLQVLEGSSELASPGMAASVAWWAHIGGFVFGALVAFVARHGPVAPAAPAPTPILAPAPAPTMLWRHANGWRVPDVRQHFPATDEHGRRI